MPDTVEIAAGDAVFAMRVRLDTARDLAYYRNGGITPYVLRRLLAARPR